MSAVFKPRAPSRLHWLPLAAVGSHTALALGTGPWLARGPWAETCALAGAAAATAFLGSRPGSGRTARLALGFVLAALVLLPAPGAMLVALAALAAGWGAGVAGPFGRGGRSASAAALALVVVQYTLAARPAVEIASPATLLSLSWMFVAVQCLAAGFGWALGAGRGNLPVCSPAQIAGRLALESANVPLAWLVARSLATAAWLEALALATLILLALAASFRLDRALDELRASHVALSSRLGELDTLHHVGRQIATSLDPSRVFEIVERECRNIFPVDACFVALLDRSTRELRCAYRQPQAIPLEHETAVVRGGIARWVLEEKRPRRVDDVRQLPADSPVHGDLLHASARAVMAVPLLVEERVIGVLGVQCRRARAYDEHHLALLTTVAQQAAVAIENARHYQMATVDSLTGFFLRDHFFQRLAEEDARVRRYGGRYALLMVDLDGFKEINDSHGHLAGDRCLGEVAATIRAELRGPDLACRYGGDEFCLLLPETDSAGARVIAERIRQAVAGRDAELRTTVSIGIAVFPDNDGGDVQALLRSADEALYRAKRCGRDQVAA